MMARPEDLTTEAIAAVDPAGMLGAVLDLPEHLRDALWRVESAGLRDADTPGGLIVAGMGASAIAGELARVALGDQASRPILTSRTYGLPAWTTPDTTVLVASYSGQTEETLTAYEAAAALGANRVVATTGGALAEHARRDGVPVIPMPGGIPSRAAVGYLTVAALEVAAACGAGPRLASEIDVAAAHLEALTAEWGPEGTPDGEAKELARALHETIPVVIGAGPTLPVARRWARQVNANAKSPAFAHELPEVDHNELAGWTGAAELGRFTAVFLDDADVHPRLGERIRLTAALIEETAASVHHVRSRGQGAVERVMSLVLLGDLLSVYLATLRGVDPTPIEAVDRLEAGLAQR